MSEWPTRREIERQLVMERAILAAVESDQYQEKRESFHRHGYGIETGDRTRYEHIHDAGYENFPVFPNWVDTVRMRIGALELMLELGEYSPPVVKAEPKGRMIDV